MDGKLQYNDYGQIAYKFWLKIPEHFSDAKLDGFIIMPNHIHGIITINNCRGEVTSPSSPDTNTIKSIKQGGETPPLREITLGQIVAYFKYQSSKIINQIRTSPGVPVWQRNYYEHIIRNETELNKIREYIINNPLNRETDENYRAD
jgi:REP element-mobilizing transposase RayT